MKNVKFSKVALALTVVLISGAACADDSGSGQLSVSATIAPECTVAQNVAINFSTLHLLDGAALSTADDVATGSINAICTNGTSSPMFRYSSANTAFKLVGQSDNTKEIIYALYQNTDATGTAVTYDQAVAHPDFSPNGAVNTLNLSARILAADKAGKAIQAYSDTITVTTSFTL
jgi:spore coat protein U-like protein